MTKRKNHENSRILFISDTHAPYQHPDALAFLTHLKKKYKPTRIIHIGDEVDGHALSYHEKNPDLPGAKCELTQAKKFLHKLEKIFPKMDIVDSNHGSLFKRKSVTAGIPSEYLKTENEIYGVGGGWQWHPEITLTLPDGRTVLCHHGMSANAAAGAMAQGCSLVQGHFHTKFMIEYYSTKDTLHFGMTMGFLGDRQSLAMLYAKDGKKRQIVGTGLIIDGLPVLEPMILDKNSRWVGR